MIGSFQQKIIDSAEKHFINDFIKIDPTTAFHKSLIDNAQMYVDYSITMIEYISTLEMTHEDSEIWNKLKLLIREVNEYISIVKSNTTLKLDICYVMSKQSEDHYNNFISTSNNYRNKIDTLYFDITTIHLD